MLGMGNRKISYLGYDPRLLLNISHILSITGNIVKVKVDKTMVVDEYKEIILFINTG